MKSREDQYGASEAKRRFEAALRGARIAGHKPMAEMRVGTPKRKPRSKKRQAANRRPR